MTLLYCFLVPDATHWAHFKHLHYRFSTSLEVRPPARDCLAPCMPQGIGASSCVRAVMIFFAPLAISRTSSC
jgi:hypothetical protein